MLLKRLLMPGLALGMILALSGMAQAQTTCGVDAASAVARATATGHTEPTGDVRVTCTTPTPHLATTAGTTLVINYGITITNTTGFPSTRPIAVNALTGDFAVAGQAAAFSVVAGVNPVSNAAGTISVLLPGIPASPGGTAAGASTTGSFNITGVLVSFNGTQKTSLSGASITIPGNTPGTNYSIDVTKDVAGTTVTSVLPGLAAPVLGSDGTATWPTNGVIGPTTDTTWSISVTENYLDMFKESLQFNNPTAAVPNTAVNPQGGVADTDLLYTFAGIPAGANISGCSAAVSPAGAVPILTSTAVDSANNTILMGFSGAFDLTSVETVTLKCTALNLGTATTPLSGAVTVTVTLAPTGTALSTAMGTPPLFAATTNVPRYQLSNSAPLTVVTISSGTGPGGSSTTLLMPYVVNGFGFSTGLGLSNTSADPFAAGITAGSQNGSITFTFFPQSGGSFSYTTNSSSPGLGLTVGLLNAGSTYVTTVGDLIAAFNVLNPTATKPTTFIGYIFVVENFPNGHGYAALTSSAGYSVATEVLVLPGTSRTTETGLSR